MKAEAFTLSNDAVSFGIIDAFSNPANLGKTGKMSASVDYRQFISNNAIPAVSFYSDYIGPKFTKSKWNMDAEQISEMNFWFGSFGVGYERADEAVGASNKDAIRLIQDFQDNAHEPGRIYNIEIAGHQKQTEKLNLYFSAPCALAGLNDLWLGANLSYIQGRSYGNASMSGIVSVESSTVTNCIFDIDADHTNSDTFGSGMSMDIGGTWKANDRLSFEMVLQNVVGYINWHNVNNTKALADTQNVVVDKYGNIINKPTISGTESVNNFREDLAFQSLWAVNYLYLDNLSFVGMIEPYNDQTSDYYVGTKWAPFNSYYLLTGYGSKYGTVSLGVEFFTMRCILFTNNASLSKADKLGVFLSGAVNF